MCSLYLVKNMRQIAPWDINVDESKSYWKRYQCFEFETCFYPDIHLTCFYKLYKWVKTSLRLADQYSWRLTLLRYAVRHLFWNKERHNMEVDLASLKVSCEAILKVQRLNQCIWIWIQRCIYWTATVLRHNWGVKLMSRITP